MKAARYLLKIRHRATKFLLTREVAKHVPALGMAGAYDIGMHYAYEEGRGVAYLSTMSRAMGGQEGFTGQSPAVILNSITDTADSPSLQASARGYHLNALEPQILIFKSSLYSMWSRKCLRRMKLA